MAKKKKAVYDGSSIKVLKGLEAVRERIGMYLGDPENGDALHHLIWEVIDNSVDEHLAGNCSKISVVLLKGGGVEISDDGRGIPVDIHPAEGISSLQLIMTTLHAGGKFDNDSYAQSAGLHGVGVSAVNAVSEWMNVHVYRDGEEWAQEYVRGAPISDVAKLGPASKGQTGTKVSFKWDPEIFSGQTDYSYDRVFKRLQELAFLNAGLEIDFTDKRKAKTKGINLCYSGGIQQYLEDIVKKEVIHKDTVFIRDVGKTKSLEIAMAWTKTQNDDIRAYTNNVRNMDGGTHLTGFRSALTKIFSQWATDNGMLKVLDEGLLGSDIRSGLTAIINLRIPNPSFSSQTKDKLVTGDARRYTEETMRSYLVGWLDTHKPQARKIVEWMVIQARAREAAKKARDTVLRKDVMDPLSLPGKLSDCQSKRPADSEIFIVEGDSAGGSAKMGRDRKYQAILPLRGKVLNTEDASAYSIFENKELGTLINALGCGLETAGNFSLKKLRYHKIIILTDADVDGAHIRTLLLTFFYRHMPQLIWGGYVYFGVPPLYRVKKGKWEHYFTSDEDFVRWQNEDPANQAGLRITRFKGLGEMNADALWHTTMDPTERVLCQVRIDDAIEAEQLFEMLMGHQNVELRREYIEANALSVQNLDI